MLASTDGFLDVVVTRLAIAQRRSFYRHQVMDRVYFFLPGRSPLVVLRGGGSATLSAVASATSFPQDVAATINASANPAYEPLWSPCRWCLESLREADPFKAFMWAFFAMERLVSKLADRFQARRAIQDPSVQERTRALMDSVGVPANDLDFTRDTPFLKLALLLVVLNESESTERLREFQEVKRFRGQLVHASGVNENQTREQATKALAWIESLLSAAMRVLASNPSATR